VPDADSDQPMDYEEGDAGGRYQPKRGQDCAESGNPRDKKAGCYSPSLSIAPTVPSSIPSTGAPTCDPSQSPFDENDLCGVSHITGGFLRGNAVGGNFNWGDAQDQMDDVLEAQSASVGKVLLFDSHADDAHPHLSITTQTVSQLPSILKRLSGKFSPIRSRCTALYKLTDN